MPRIAPIQLVHVLAFVLPAACMGAPVTGPVGSPSAPSGAVVRELPPGTVIQLDRIRVVEGSFPDLTVANGLLREALRLSPRFDVAGGIESAPTDGGPMDVRWVLEPVLDARAERLSLSLLDRHEETAAAPVGGVDVGSLALPTAIDELAWAARVALGETVDEQPPRCAQIYSSVPECVRLTERALIDAERGLRGSSSTQIDRARRRDPGCTITRLAHASHLLDRGEVDEAIRIANEALTLLSARLSPTTQQRLARVLLLARAKQAGPAAAQQFDRRLLELGEIGMRERPYDPHPRYTRALALCYVEGETEDGRRTPRFAEAVEDLRALRARWPRVPWVAYHLCFAELAIGEPQRALESIESAARQLPNDRVVLPMALALYEAGEARRRASERAGEPIGDPQRELRRYLERLARRVANRDDNAIHEVRRIRASHAILDGDDDEAARQLLDDLEWLRQRPTRLTTSAADVAEEGEVLIALGRASELSVRIAALHEVEMLAPSVGHALVYLSGLVLVTRNDEAVETAIESLEQQREAAWSTLLKAAVHKKRGELLQETAELKTAILIADSALVRTSLARVLRTSGKVELADELIADMRAQMRSIDLRRPLRHPLLSPGRALAWRETR